MCLGLTQNANNLKCVKSLFRYNLRHLQSTYYGHYCGGDYTLTNNFHPLFTVYILQFTVEGVQVKNYHVQNKV